MRKTVLLLALVALGITGCQTETPVGQNDTPEPTCTGCAVPDPPGPTPSDEVVDLGALEDEYGPVAVALFNTLGGTNPEISTLNNRNSREVCLATVRVTGDENLKIELAQLDDFAEVLQTHGLPSEVQFEQQHAKNVLYAGDDDALVIAEPHQIELSVPTADAQCK